MQIFGWYNSKYMDDKIQKDNLTDLASSLVTQSDNSQPQQSDNNQSTETNNNQQSEQAQQPTQNLADNQVVGSNGEVIDLGRTSEDSINK
jgi:hypothetical protein